MYRYFEIFTNSWSGYASYVWYQILQPSWHNYFYWLVFLSVSIYVWELVFPWRKNQPAIREGFFIDLFYIVWNYFLFSLLIYNALSDVVVNIIKDAFAYIGIKNYLLFDLQHWPRWAILAFVFVFRDFMQWTVHRLMHHTPWMWSFHRVHHSTEQMGFAASMRYHFMEHLIYRSFEYFPLALFGFGLTDFFVVHIFTFLLNQLGHANIYLPLGTLKYIFNNPQMHLWHHAKEMPEEHPLGFNFGISLSIWDYLFGTAYWPSNDKNLAVGLPDSIKLEKGFVAQMLDPFRSVFK